MDQNIHLKRWPIYFLAISDLGADYGVFTYYDSFFSIYDLFQNYFQQKYHNGNSVIVPNIFIATFGNFFMKVVLNERLPREKQYILHEYDNLFYKYSVNKL